ncbi:peptidase S10 [Paraglaciecola chathamensis]|uniref:Peptidase S10 n=1 Tax=Paraglaciecola chathamensis TaxID=368405 RepID=A0ABS0WDS8_9ALTE|nr:peptidase S10 [Paraglaciecola chathamensis]MBJ2136629.1 peptidase S10 [Paraglaciecola chathamensis]
MQVLVPYIKPLIGIWLMSVAIHCHGATAQQNDSNVSPKVFTSEHKVKIAGTSLSYTAIAGETWLKDEQGLPTAAIWSTSYVKKGKSKRARPVTFIFNGGPGASSMGLHIGLLGPKIVELPDLVNGDDGVAPYNLIDNPNSLLAVSDLVFVDPVGTGFSHVIGKGKNQDFWSMGGDTQSMADFIHQWITDNQRWNSPKHILGLSYGTTRAVDVAYFLSAHYGMDVNSLMLLGSALEMAALSPVDNNFMAYFSFVPTMAAVAHFHGKAGQGKTLAEFTAEAETFVINELMPALIMGSRLSKEQKNQVAQRYADFTGLSRDYILKSNLKILIPNYRKELLRDQGLTLGRGDGRITGMEYNNAADSPLIGDPVDYKSSGIYGASFYQYLSTLGVEMDRKYNVWNTQVGKYWDWSPDIKAYSNPQRYRVAKRVGIIEVGSKLGKLMRWNTDLDVFVASGWYDLVTPLFDTKRTFSSNGIVPERVNIHHYSSGHRLWLDVPTQSELLNDLTNFYQLSE